MKIRRLLLALALAIGGILTLALPASAATPPMPFGLYAAGDHPVTPSDYAGFNDKPASSIYYAWQLTSDVMTPPAVLSADKAQGIKPFIELQTGSEPLASVAAGANDSQLIASAKALEANGRPVYMTFDHEMNGSWKPWNGSPTDWIRSWNHVTKIFYNYAPGLVTWIWAPNVDGGATPASPWWRNGSQFVLRVSEIGLDGYLCITQKTGSCSQSFASVFAQSKAQIRQYTQLPIIVSETGIGPPGNRVPEINAMVSAARSEGFTGLDYFNQAGFALTAPQEAALGAALKGSPVTTTAAENCITVATGANGTVSTANISAAESATGTTFNCLNTFANPMPTWADWEAPWQFSGQTSWADWLKSDPSHQVILGMDLVPWSATGGTGAPVANPLTWEAAGASGAYDGYAAQLARNLVADGAFANGQPLVIRLGIEANGNWEADWVGGTPAEAADWAQTYDHEVAAMRAVPGTNFRFEWNPNACYSVGTGSLASYYPGNAYVDVIGGDLYDSDCAVSGASAASEGFAALESHGSPSMNDIIAFADANGKPLTLGEWGLEGADDAAYVNGVGAMIHSGDFASQAYFDNGHDGITQLGPSIPNATAAYRAQFGS